MKTVVLKSEPHEEPVVVRLERTDAQHADRHTVHWGDQQADVECQLEDGVGLLHIHGRTVRFFAARHDHHVTVWAQGKTHTFEIVQRTPQRATAQESAVAVDTVQAPMPGVILGIEIQEGAAFEAHQPLIIMESMKMEMTLWVPHNGRVAEVRCAVGQRVETGTVLARVDQSHE